MQYSQFGLLRIHNELKKFIYQLFCLFFVSVYFLFYLFCFTYFLTLKYCGKQIEICINI